MQVCVIRILMFLIFILEIIYFVLHFEFEFNFCPDLHRISAANIRIYILLFEFGFLIMITGSFKTARHVDTQSPAVFFDLHGLHLVTCTYAQKKRVMTQVRNIISLIILL